MFNKLIRNCDPSRDLKSSFQNPSKIHKNYSMSSPVKSDPKTKKDKVIFSYNYFNGKIISLALD